ncbi:hypothetical protein AgCh_000327 [Apium graveolens]
MDDKTYKLIGADYPGNRKEDVKDPDLLWMMIFISVVSFLGIFSLTPLLKSKHEAAAFHAVARAVGDKIRSSKFQIESIRSSRFPYTVELTNEAVDFLKETFSTLDIDGDGSLRTCEVEDLFSTAPESNAFLAFSYGFLGLQNPIYGVVIAHVKPSKILLPGFTKAKQTQPLKIAISGFEARVVTGKEARDKSGLGSSDERRVHNTTNDPTSLRGRVFQIRKNVIPLKYFEELEHVLFFLHVKNRSTNGAADYLKSNIQRQKKLYSVKSDSPYFPKYRDHKGDIVEMKPNTAKIMTTFLGYKVVEINLESDKAYLIRLDQDIRKAKINDLRAAILQTDEDTAELKNAKRRTVNELEYAERCLLKNYLRTTPDIIEIRN